MRFPVNIYFVFVINFTGHVQFFIVSFLPRSVLNSSISLSENSIYLLNTYIPLFLNKTLYSSLYFLLILQIQFLSFVVKWILLYQLNEFFWVSIWIYPRLLLFIPFDVDIFDNISLLIWCVIYIIITIHRSYDPANISYISIYLSAIFI